MALSRVIRKLRMKAYNGRLNEHDNYLTTY